MANFSKYHLLNAEVAVQERSGNGNAIITVAILYFMMGFITCLNDTLVPFFKRGFALSYSQSSLVQVYFFLTYGLVSVPAGKMVERIGYKKGIVSGLFMAAFGALLFFPASVFHRYELFLAALFILAIGIVTLQVAVNPYITILGPAKTASSRLAMIQGIGSLGTTVAPVLGSYFILSRLSESTISSDAVRYPYLGITSVLFLIACIVIKLQLPNLKYETTSAVSPANSSRGIFSFRNLNFGIWAIFAYVGAEVSIGTFLTNYIANILKIDEAQANAYVAFYWGSMLVGRFIGSAILKSIKPSVFLIINAFLAIIMILVSLNSSGSFAVWSMIAVGFFNSVMFAIIFSLSVNGVGKYTTQASGLLSTAIVGGALIPLIQGIVKDNFDWTMAFAVPVLCYAYILFYGANGYKSNSN